MLRVSDAFTAGEIPMGRFHIVGCKSLPRFGVGRPAIREAARPGAGPCPVGVLSRGGTEAQEQPARSELREENPGEAGVETRPAEVDRPRGGWVLCLLRWLSERLRRRRNPFRSAGPRLSSTVVPRQGCLKLEGVQVVRNDLSDADFEVVPIRRGGGEPGQRAASVGCGFLAGRRESMGATTLQVSNL
jgi:hypothetical protein